MNYYEHHLGDYAAATAHLSMIEDGAYRRLMDLYYRIEGPLPQDARSLHRLVRANAPEERKTVDAVLQEFFELGPDGWHQKRCDEEVTKYRTKREQARNAGLTSAATRRQRNGNGRSTDVEQKANGPPTEIQPSQSPVTSHQTPDNPRVDDFVLEPRVEVTSSSKRKLNGHPTARRIATRLTPDWEPDEWDQAFCRDHGLSPQTLGAQFRDHWIAVPGQRGVKLDWHATFRNWVRREAMSR